MTHTVSPRLAGYAGLAALGLVTGLVSGRVELVALAAPFALASVVGWAVARPPRIEAALSIDRERALEDEQVMATLELAAPDGADRVDVLFELRPRCARSCRIHVRCNCCRRFH